MYHHIDGSSPFDNRASLSGLNSKHSGRPVSLHCPPSTSLATPGAQVNILAIPCPLNPAQIYCPSPRSPTKGTESVVMAIMPVQASCRPSPCRACLRWKSGKKVSKLRSAFSTISSLYRESSVLNRLANVSGLRVGLDRDTPRIRVPSPCR